MILLLILAAIICLVLGLTKIAAFLLWVGLIGLAIGLILLVADGVRGR